MMPRASLRTERLVLEPLGSRHAEAVWEATRESLPELQPWLAWAHTASREQTEAFARDAERTWEAGTDYNFAVVADAAVAGTIGLHTPWPNRPIGELGYWLRSDFTRRGYATEAGRAVVRFGFRELGLSRLELRAGLDNLPSQRVAERLGFRREGLTRRGCHHPDGGYDCYLYGLLPGDLEDRAGDAWATC